MVRVTSNTHRPQIWTIISNQQETQTHTKTDQASYNPHFRDIPTPYKSALTAFLERLETEHDWGVITIYGALSFIECRKYRNVLQQSTRAECETA